MALQPYTSHARGILDNSPIEDYRRNVVAFDGRLDNYEELANELGVSEDGCSEGSIVLSAFRRWGDDCFSRFAGDWAIALWSDPRQTLYLARDHAGSRTIYFKADARQVLWSTYLDSLVIDSRTDAGVSKAYVARYLTQLPLRELTPYEGIRSVLPGHCVTFSRGRTQITRHWSALIEKRVEYRSEADYDEHFRALLRQAVDRRSGPGAPVLAELSGGMDSTSIVCMSDHSRRTVADDATILDTISYFDDSESTLDEKAYFSITERCRGKVGTHLSFSSRQRTYEPHDRSLGRYLLPGADSSSFAKEQMLVNNIWERGFRSILSGVGGDEVFGGNPAGTPELADYVLSLRVKSLCKQAIAWSLPTRDPLIFTLASAAAYAVNSFFLQETVSQKRIPWISRRLSRSIPQHSELVSQVLPRLRIGGSKWDNALSWWSIMETLPHQFPRILHRVEYRYPLLDKDLVEYAFSVPRTEIFRPGRRRLMMRRALRGIVPAEILERRRKAYQIRAPLMGLREASSNLRAVLGKNSLLAQHGFVEPKELLRQLDRIDRGDADHWQAMVRAIALELWFRSNSDAGAIHKAA
jgi:asparagine synthase (glutamine-hydrolysing)